MCLNPKGQRGLGLLLSAVGSPPWTRGRKGQCPGELGTGPSSVSPLQTAVGGTDTWRRVGSSAGLGPRKMGDAGGG